MNRIEKAVDEMAAYVCDKVCGHRAEEWRGSVGQKGFIGLHRYL